MIDGRDSMVDNDSVTRSLAAFIGTEGIPTLEEAKAAEGCADSMLKLGDAFMFGLHMPQSQRDPKKACDYYYKAAYLNQPEACIAVAMMYYAKLFPHLPLHVRSFFIKCSYAILLYGVLMCFFVSSCIILSNTTQRIYLIYFYGALIN